MPEESTEKFIPNVPPPPPEVKVRTLQSDLESIRESGGGMPRFKSIAVPKSGEAASETKLSGFFWKIFVPIVAIGALVVSFYLMYGVFVEE